jgi:hypothetical protein
MREPPLFISDQAAAAAAENLAKFTRKSRHRTLDPDTEPLAAAAREELVDTYREACAEARTRYEEATPKSQWVAGRSRMGVCEDLQGGPAPSHWCPAEPDVLLCDSCWGEVYADPAFHQCMKCGEQQPNLVHISTIDPHSPVTLHAVVCNDCYADTRTTWRRTQMTYSADYDDGWDATDHPDYIKMEPPVPLVGDTERGDERQPPDELEIVGYVRWATREAFEKTGKPMSEFQNMLRAAGNTVHMRMDCGEMFVYESDQDPPEGSPRIQFATRYVGPSGFTYGH